MKRQRTYEDTTPEARYMVREANGQPIAVTLYERDAILLTRCSEILNLFKDTLWMLYHSYDVDGESLEYAIERGVAFLKDIGEYKENFFDIQIVE